MSAPIILQTSKGFYLVSDQTSTKLTGITLLDAVKEALEIDPATNTNIWIDKNHLTQPILFEI